MTSRLSRFRGTLSPAAQLAIRCLPSLLPLLLLVSVLGAAAKFFGGEELRGVSVEESMAASDGGVRECDTLYHHSPRFFELGFRLRELVLTDLNSDNLPDVIVASEFANQVLVLYNLGGAAFSNPIPIPVGQNPMGVSVADMDGDGDKDVVVTNSNSNSISTIINEGGDEFVVKNSYLTGTYPADCVTINLDHQVLPDCAVLNGLSNNISIFVNSGSGSLSLLTTTPIGVAANGILAEDMDSDGDQDLIISCESPGLQVLINDGDGRFTIGEELTVTGVSGGLILGDFDGDLDNDLLVTAVGGLGKVLAFERVGSLLSYKGEYAVGGYPFRGCAEDLDQDGDLDVALAHDGAGTFQISFLFNNGDGSFCQVADMVEFEERSVGVYGGDVDGDSDTDLILVHWGWVRSGLTILRNARIGLPGDANGNGAVSISDVVFLINYIFAGGAAPNPLSSGDVNCSGAISISDAVFLINYIFAGGAAPCQT